MPEGPEIRRAADAIERALAGQRVGVRFLLPALTQQAPRFEGVRLLRVDTRGKAMLSRFDNGLTIYSHNQLYGRWFVLPAGERPETRRSLRLAFEGETHHALLYSASEIAVLDAAAEAAHPFLSRLGPNVLDPALRAETVIERLLEPRFRRRRLGALLTDQRFLAGLGNYLRCEILFVAGLRPERRPAELVPAELERLAAACLELPRRSRETGGLVRDPRQARDELARGQDFERVRFHVYRRAGDPCYRCGTAVQREAHGGQHCYLCPGCQV